MICEGSVTRLVKDLSTSQCWFVVFSLPHEVMLRLLKHIEISDEGMGDGDQCLASLGCIPVPVTTR